MQQTRPTVQGGRRAPGNSSRRGQVLTKSRKPRDSAKAKADLLAVATEVFSRLGYYGARVDEIADRSTTTKRMIYYYFGDKDGLFTAVLERAYADIRAAEAALNLTGLPPLEALTTLIAHTFRWHAAHPEAARLISAENALKAAHLRRSQQHTDTNRPIIALIDDILARGLADGPFVRKASALELHLQITALALFQVTNAATIDATFGVDLTEPENVERAAATLASMMTTWLCHDDPI